MYACLLQYIPTFSLFLSFDITFSPVKVYFHTYPVRIENKLELKSPLTYLFSSINPLTYINHVSRKVSTSKTPKLTHYFKPFQLSRDSRSSRELIPSIVVTGERTYWFSGSTCFGKGFFMVRQIQINYFK